MTATAATTTPQSTRSRGLARQIAILVSSVLAIVAAFIGSGAFFGTPIQQAAGGFLDADSTLIAPGTGAFRIWSVIYTGMLAYAIWQALPAQRDDPRQIRIGWWVAASLILNAVWIGVVQADLLYLSLPVIAALLAVLCRIFVILRRTSPKNTVEAVVADGAIGLYLGWVIIATAANATAILVAAGFDRIRHRARSLGRAGAGASRPPSASRSPSGAAGRIAPALSLCWGISWVAVARFTDEPYSPDHRDRRHQRSRPHHRRDGVRASATRPSRATLGTTLHRPPRVGCHDGGMTRRAGLGWIATLGVAMAALVTVLVDRGTRRRRESASGPAAAYDAEQLCNAATIIDVGLRPGPVAARSDDRRHDRDRRVVVAEHRVRRLGDERRAQPRRLTDDLDRAVPAAGRMGQPRGAAGSAHRRHPVLPGDDRRGCPSPSAMPSPPPSSPTAPRSTTTPCTTRPTGPRQ